MVSKKNLSEIEEQKIEAFARNKLIEYGKLNDIIGPQIFTILGRHSRVLYYPLMDDDIWGFVEKVSRGTFVCINTSIDYDKQVFVAAHELYHILHGSSGELVLAEALENPSPLQETVSVEELKANRFAAAFLIQSDLLESEMTAMGIAGSTIAMPEILRLANVFTVPYKTMARRLFERRFINEEQLSEYLAVSHAELEVMKKRLGLLMPTQDKAIVLDTMVETAMSLYEKKLITVEKLEQILRYSNFTLEDMGISKPEFTPLTDAEIDALLEE